MSRLLPIFFVLVIFLGCASKSPCWKPDFGDYDKWKKTGEVSTSEPSKKGGK